MVPIDSWSEIRNLLVVGDWNCQWIRDLRDPPRLLFFSFDLARSALMFPASA